MWNLLIKMYINIPKNIQISWGKDFLKVTGPLGTVLKKKYGFELLQKDSKLYILLKNKELNINFYFAMLRNLFLGVSKGYRKKLKLVGVGYRASIKDNKLLLNIGYSHDVVYEIPQDVKIFTAKLKGTFILIKGKEQYRVNQVASEIRALQKPDAYKGKGIQFNDEVIKLKQGKREGK